MLHDVVEAKALKDHQVFVRFDDGVEGVVDITAIVSLDGVFAPLADQKEFEKLFVDQDLGTVCWPCGTDLDPVVLRSQVTGEPLPGCAGKRAA